MIEHLLRLLCRFQAYRARAVKAESDLAETRAELAKAQDALRYITESYERAEADVNRQSQARAKAEAELAKAQELNHRWNRAAAQHGPMR